MGLPSTLKERFEDAEIKALCTGMFLLDNTKRNYSSLSITLRVSDLQWCPTALTEKVREHLKMSQVFNGVPYPRANMLFLRMHLASLWSNVAQC